MALTDDNLFQQLVRLADEELERAGINVPKAHDPLSVLKQRLEPIMSEMPFTHNELCKLLDLVHLEGFMKGIEYAIRLGAEWPSG